MVPSIYRSESFELHKILRAMRKRQFSAPAKFTTSLISPSQSLAPLGANSWTLGSSRPTQKSWTLDHRYFGGAVVNVLRADTALLERCRALKHPLRWWTLVWRWYMEVSEVSERDQTLAINTGRNGPGTQARVFGSVVNHSTTDQGIASSTPLTPTKLTKKGDMYWFFPGKMHPCISVLH